MSVSEEEVVLKESIISTFDEEVSELMITCAWSVTAFVEVKKSASLDDVRIQIYQILGDDIIMKKFYLKLVLWLFQGMRRLTLLHGNFVGSKLF